MRFIRQANLKTALSFEIGLPIKRIYFEALSGTPEESIAYEKSGNCLSRKFET